MHLLKGGLARRTKSLTKEGPLPKHSPRKSTIFYSHFASHWLKGDELGASVKEADVEANLVDVPGRGGHRGVEGAGRVWGGADHLALGVDQVRAGCCGVDVTRGAGGGLDHGFDVVGVVGGDEDGGRGAEVGGGRACALEHGGSARIWCSWWG